jgi:hypothetical protein
VTRIAAREPEHAEHPARIGQPLTEILKLAWFECRRHRPPFAARGCGPARPQKALLRHLGYTSA